MKTTRDTTLLAILIAVTVLTFAALLMSISSISLQRWMSYDVKRPKDAAEAKADLTYFSRWRGMFMECLKDPNQAENVAWLAPKRTSSCYALDMGRSPDDHEGSNYWFLIRLRRAHVAMVVLSIIFILLTVLLAGTSLALMFLRETYETPLHSRIIRGTGVACLLTLLCYLASLFIFHVLMDEEKTNKAVLPGTFINWPVTVAALTTISYGAAYFLLWASFFCTLLAGLLLLTLCWWGLDLVKQVRTVHTIEEKTVLMGGPYGQPMVKQQETVQGVSVTPVHMAPSM